MKTLDELRTKHENDPMVTEIVQDLSILPSSETTGPNTPVNPKKPALNSDFKEVLL